MPQGFAQEFWVSEDVWSTHNASLSWFGLLLLYYRRGDRFCGTKEALWTLPCPLQAIHCRLSSSFGAVEKDSRLFLPRLVVLRCCASSGKASGVGAAQEAHQTKWTRVHPLYVTPSVEKHFNGTPFF